MIRAEPHTKLRSKIVSILKGKGYIDDKYNTDNLCAYVSWKNTRTLHIFFWDCGMDLSRKDKEFKEILKLIGK